MAQSLKPVDKENCVDGARGQNYIPSTQTVWKPVGQDCQTTAGQV